jgi:polyglutamine-binding protein 1
VSIIKRKNVDVEEEEEIIAESYDEPSETSKSGSKSSQGSAGGSLSNRRSNCPNQHNPYHECSKYCFEKYGYKKFQPNAVMEKRRIRMLKIYPLPANWVEVPDLDTYI